MPLERWMSPETAVPETTGSIPQPTVAAPAPDTDGDVIRRRIEDAVATPAAEPLQWTNPGSGHSGTITRIVTARAVNGAPCRDFDTTVVSVAGIHLYRGQACQGYAGPWDLVRLDPVDGEAPLGFAASAEASQ